VNLSRRIALLFLLFVALNGATTACSDSRSIVVASTTSTQDSGLFDYLLPRFKQRTGIEVKVVAQGTGQALETGRRGDADVVFVHARAQEEAFVSEGAGVHRYPVMYNDFVLIGPATDPAASRGKDISSALLAIRKSGGAFISRGDNSGTHIAEINLWKRAGIEIEQEHGAWYRSIGQGMGAALNTAAAASAYVIADRGTWISFKNKRDLAVLVEGDASLLNQYGVILVNPRTHPQVKATEGQAFIDWLISAEGQAAIAAFRIEGQQLFFPNARQAP
jgi:tungstate transport system substrate-binding protein